MAEPETTARLRQAIDSGETGEKVAYRDPAAAPLGTDSEAGGQPVADATTSQTPVRRHRGPGVWLYPLLAVPVCIDLLVIVATTG